MVVAYHSGLASVAHPVPGGFTGVDVFFVVSGFVITGMLLRQLQAGGRLSFRAFYARRARRLLPALALMIAIVSLLSSVLLSPIGPQEQVAKTGAAASVFAANAYVYSIGSGYFDLGVKNNVFLHTWSLSVEEQFYLVFPALVLLGWGLGRRGVRKALSPPRRGLFMLMSIGVAASFVLSYWLTTRNPHFAFYSSLTRAWEFGVGALLALGAREVARIPRHAAVVGGFVGASLLVVAATSIDEATPFPGAAALLPVGGTALLLAAGTSATSGTTALLSVRPAVWLGDRSYSWYLWHWPVIIFARILWPTATWELFVVGAASIIPAWASHRFIENRFRYDTRYAGRRAVALVAACVGIGLLASGALLLSARLGAATDVGASLASQTVPLHADLVRGCDSPVPLSARRDPDCTWRTDSSKGEIFLVGDSNAGQFTEPAARAAIRSGFDLTVATFSSCPFVDLELKRNSVVQDDCRRFVEKSLASLLRHRPALVFVASAATSYIVNDVWELKNPRTGVWESSRSNKADAWASGLASVLRTLDESGIPAVVIHVLPHISTFLPQDCPAVLMLLDSMACNATLSRAEVREQRGTAMAAETRALAAAPSAVGVDFADEVCPGHACTARRGRLWIYRDAVHLSVAGSKTLFASFAGLIERQAQRTRESSPI